MMLVDLYTEYAKEHLTSGGYYGTATLDQFIRWLKIKLEFDYKIK